MIAGYVAAALTGLLLLGLRYWDRKSGGKAPKEPLKPLPKKPEGESPKGKGKGKGAKVSGYYQDGIADDVSKADIGRAIVWMVKNAPNLKSPIAPIADDDKWTKFVRALTVAAGVPGRVGIFGFSPKRLGEIEPNITSTTDQSPDAQLGWFKKSVLDYIPVILDRHDADFNQPGFALNGKPVTLSGLLALAHLAGIEGMTSWLSNDRDKAKFKATTAAFNAANGLF